MCGQRYGNWFILRQLRSIASATSDLLLRSPGIHTSCQFSHSVPGYARDFADTSAALLNIWFSQGRSTEPIIRVAVNYKHSLQSNERYDWIWDIFDIGMVCSTARPWNVFSADDNAILFYPNGAEDPFQCRTCYTVCVEGRLYRISCFETETAVARKNLHSRILYIFTDIDVLFLVDSDVLGYIPKQHKI